MTGATSDVLPLKLLQKERGEKVHLQVDQLQKIFAGALLTFEEASSCCPAAVLGKPTPQQWPLITELQFYAQIKDWPVTE